MLPAWDQANAALGRRPPGGTSARAAKPGNAGILDERTLRPGRADFMIAGAYLAAALLVTCRLWADPASRTVAGNPDDADLFAWYMRYAATAIAHGHLPALTSTAMNAPWGVNLMWNSSLLIPCVLLAPVTLLFGPQVSLTVLTTAGFAGSAAALFIVLRRWNVSRTASAMAGAVYGFSPALVHSAMGHYNLQLAVLPPLIIDAGLRLVISPDHRLLAAARRGGWLGLLVGVQIFVSEELALTTACAGVLLAVLATGVRLPAARRLGPAVVGLGVAATVAMIIAGWALLTQFTGSLTQQGSPFLRDYYVNDLTGFVTPSRYLFFHTAGAAAAAARYQGQAPEYLGYLGWPLIIVLAVAAVAFWRRPAVRALAVTFVVLEVFSLGGHPLVSGTSHPDVPLPWHWIEGLPLARSVLPDRWSILADGVAASLLAITLDLARSRWAARQAGNPVTARRIRPMVLLLAVGVLACLPMLPRPLPPARPAALPVGWRATLAALRLSPGARVLVVPLPQVHLTDAMRWRADTSQDYSLIGGYFIGPAWDGHAYVDGSGPRPTAVYLDQLWAAGLGGSRLAAASLAAAGLPPLGAPPSAAQARADLAAWKPGAVLAVTAPGSRLARYLTGLLGAPRFRFGHVLSWRR